GLPSGGKSSGGNGSGGLYLDAPSTGFSSSLPPPEGPRVDVGIDIGREAGVLARGGNKTGDCRARSEGRTEVGRLPRTLRPTPWPVQATWPSPTPWPSPARPARCFEIYAFCRSLR